MYKLRARSERGKTRTNWLDSSHTFSFGEYYDLANMGFSALRVINDDYLAPGGGFGAHKHDNMEIISIVLNGELEHKDNMGNTSIIKRGEIQKMTAGTGIIHSEFNPSDTSSVHFLQIWIYPDKKNLEPSYQQQKFDECELTNKLRLIVSPEGKEDSISIHQDVKIYQTLLEEDKTVEYTIIEDRKYWIQAALGEVEVNGQVLREGDGLAISEENGILKITGLDTISNVLLFDLEI